MNEITHYESMFKRNPILLLDDVFSEFDVQNKKMILELIRKYQTILTTTEEETVERIDIPKKIIRV
jgi:DNA replication and repair protein RecF